MKQTEQFKIGVMVDSFRVGITEGIKKAAEIGAEGIQIYATNGEMAPQNLNAAKRREILDRIQSSGLVVSALCGDMGGHGFAIAKDNPARVEQSKRIMDLAKDLETDVVTTHIGVIPSDPGQDQYRILQDALGAMGEYGDEVGAHFAIETGPEKATVLKGFLDSLSSGGVRVNLDPANLVMITDEDPVEAVHILKDDIVHTHAKDGVMKQKTDPERIYNFFAEGGIEDLRLEDYFLETPLGQGDVDFPKYLKALEEAGFHGFLTIEREVGKQPEKDIRLAVDFLKDILR